MLLCAFSSEVEFRDVSLVKPGKVKPSAGNQPWLFFPKAVEATGTTAHYPEKGF
jgi:hypothetical protein